MGPKKDTKEFNPFPGLRPFAPEDRDLFFGRKAESDEIIAKLLKNRYITLIGTSGNGKTSLINAGVLPGIMNLKNEGSAVWKILSFTPGKDPFGNLSDILSNGINGIGQKGIDRDSIYSDLLNNSGGFSEVARKYLIKSDENVLLVIDQFDEFFRYISPGKSDTTQAALKFTDFLIESALKQDPKVFIIVAIRAEYLTECSHYKGLIRLVNNSNYIVPPIGPENLREIIEAPVNIGSRIDHSLVDEIIADLKGRTDQLSLLQHTMMRTWTLWNQLGDLEKPLTRADYIGAGTIDDALSLHAEEAYEELSAHSKGICAVMFKAITRKGTDNRGKRHPSDIATIMSVARCSKEELYEVIEKFRIRERSFIKPQADVILNDATIIEIQNECLIRSWDRLRKWIDDEDSSIRMYLGLSEASALYQQGKANLCKQPDLQAAINWRDLFKPSLSWAVQFNPAFERAMVYLRTSEKAYIEEEQNKLNLQDRKNKRIRLTMRIFGITILVAAGFVLFEYTQKSNADKQALLAEKQKIEAVKEKAKADSSVLVARTQKSISDSNTTAALQDAEEARKQKIVSDIQRSYAEKNAELALKEKAFAEDNRVGIQRMRMLSIGKSMSLKSLQMTGQKDLQTLLAYQAYLFNKTNNGPDNDADIYAGLYNVALQYGNINYKSYRGHKGEIRSIAYVPGKNEFFTSGNDGQILKWSLDNKDKTLQVIYSGNDIVDVLAVSPDASWLACGGSSSAIRMIPLKGNSIGYEMNGHKGGIKSLIFSYDGKYLYSAALDGKVLKWDIAARTSINVATGSIEITSIDISSKGNYLAGISADGNVVVWDPDHNSDKFRIETAGKNIKTVRFNPENNLLAVGDADGTVELWDISLHKKLSEVKAHNGQVNDIQFNAVLKQMATAGNDKKLKIFNINDPADLSEPPVTIADNEGFVLVMKFSPDGQVIISGESGGENNLIRRPAHVDYLVNDVCNLVSRNMTQEEWNIYVGKDIPLEKTCQGNNFNIKIEPVKSLSRKE
jgi:WD40 repeat protein